MKAFKTCALRQKKIKKVTVEMWHGFPKGPGEIFPPAQIMSHRFHIMKLFFKSLKTC
ncbi:transposase [Laspinema palackyanum]|uniref:transposase n=1 Tax=Laspinema palackyanum TaxID=3231601 RepID=UPI00349F1573